MVVRSPVSPSGSSVYLVGGVVFGTIAACKRRLVSAMGQRGHGRLLAFALDSLQASSDQLESLDPGALALPALNSTLLHLVQTLTIARLWPGTHRDTRGDLPCR